MLTNSDRRSVWEGRLFAAIAAALLSCQLVVPPIVGLADNGDFVKVIGRFDLYGKVYRPYQFIDALYEFHPERHWVSDFYSSETLLVLPALALNSLFSTRHTFDLRFIGVVHGALFLAALGLFAPLLANSRRAVRIAMYLLILFIYCDVMYVSGFNSFYMDEPALLFLLLSAVLYLRVGLWHKRSDMVLLILCVLLMVTAKTPHAVLGFFFAGLLLVYARKLWPAAGLILAASLLMIWKGSPSDYTSFPLFNVVFVQILPHSRNQVETLSALGLDESYRASIGHSAFDPDAHIIDPGHRADFDRRLSIPKLAVFYLTHPVDAYMTLRDGAGEAGRQRLGGNYDISAGYPPRSESRSFAYWSTLKQRLFFHHGSRFLFVFVMLSAIFGALLCSARKDLPESVSAAGFTLIGMAFTELAICSMLDAGDMARHHLVFWALFDMMLLAAIYLGVMRASPARSYYRDRSQPHPSVLSGRASRPSRA